MNSNASLEYFHPEISVTDLSKNQVYVTYNNISRFLVILIIPLMLLIYWNYNIYKHTKNTSACLEETINEQTRRKQENELANVLIGIVIFFIFCHFPRLFISIHEILAYKPVCSTDRRYYYTVVGAIAQDFLILMLSINSSLNTIIYYFLTSSFWKDCFGCK